VPSAALGPAAPNDMPHWPWPGEESSQRPDMLTGAALEGAGDGDDPGISKPAMRSPLQPANVAASRSANGSGGRRTLGPGRRLERSLQGSNVIRSSAMLPTQLRRSSVELLNKVS
jgi:hypothetical protein